MLAFTIFSSVPSLQVPDTETSALSAIMFVTRLLPTSRATSLNGKLVTVKAPDGAFGTDRQTIPIYSDDIHMQIRAHQRQPCGESQRATMRGVKAVGINTSTQTV